jgi:hypothetical protein
MQLSEKSQSILPRRRSNIKGAVLDCVNKGIMEAAIAMQWIKATRTKKSVRITNQQASISAEKNKRKVNEVSMKKSCKITSQDDRRLLPRPQSLRPAASDDIPFASIAASSSIPNSILLSQPNFR